MSKYICNDCGETFDYPSTCIERYPYGDGFVTDEFGTCPACGSGDFETTSVCKCCGAVIPDSQALYHLCNKCESMADSELVGFYDNLSPQARKYLDDFRLGGWLADAVKDIQKGTVWK